MFTLELPDDSILVLRAEQLPPYWQDDNYSRSQTILADSLAQPDVLAFRVVEEKALLLQAIDAIFKKYSKARAAYYKQEKRWLIAPF